jgi:hypothetical protein
LRRSVSSGIAPGYIVCKSMKAPIKKAPEGALLWLKFV